MGQPAKKEYDLSLFAPREERAPAESAEKQSIQKQQSGIKRSLTPAAVLKYMISGLLVGLSLMAVVYSNVELNHLTDQLAAAKSDLSAAQSMEIQLSVQLQSRTSLKNAENYAVNVAGMRKIGQYQITYIHLDDADQVNLTPESENIFERIYNSILAYL